MVIRIRRSLGRLLALVVGEEPARAGCAFSTLIRAATLAAMSRNAAARARLVR